jgi:acetyl esterase/lipase
MASLQAHFVSYYTRTRIKSRLKVLRDVEGIRKAQLEGRLKPPSKVRFDEASVGGVPCEVAESVKSKPSATLLYIHGGGCSTCSPLTHRPITGFFAKHGFRVFAPQYRLAPEHPFPAALDDLCAVWNVISAEGPVAIAGDSAGAYLGLSLMLRLQMEGKALPVAAALFSPVTDLTISGESVIKNNDREAMLSLADLEDMRDRYLRDTDPAHPLASPLFGDFSGFPPLLIHVGEREILLDDSTRLASKAQNAGVKVHLKVWRVVPHAWQMMHSFVPEARKSLKIAAEFLHNELKGAAGSNRKG